MKLPAALAAIAAILPHFAASYEHHEEATYLANFANLTSSSHSDLSTPDTPPLLLSSCVNQGKLSSLPLADVVVSGSGDLTSTAAQSECGVDSHCIIPQNVKLVMDSNLNVGALTLHGGQLDWNDSDDNDPSSYYLCAGYIIANTSTSLFHVDLSNKSSKGYIYLKNNGASPSNVEMMGTRVLGTDNGGNMIIKGGLKKRSWTLLSQSFGIGDSEMKVLHDVAGMGWELGDRIGIAPTVHGSMGTGQTFTITSISSNYTIGLSSINTNSQTYEATFINGQSSSSPILQSAEVINLSRNVIITGDDFEHVPCDASITDGGGETSSKGCKCSANREHCTVGLHTIHHSHGMGGTPGTMQIENAKVEKCGQRGIEGKYCLHFHKAGDCPNCIFANNAIEYGHHRGITVHGTHRSTVTNNVVWDVRGANVYIEDGNEMHNDISYNVAICPHSLNDPIQQGCSIPGTSTPGADAPNAAFYSKAATNDWTGNRAANTYNGMLLDAGTRGSASGNVCASDAALGRWVGNTMHGCSRFGLYTLGHGGNFPKHTDRSVHTNGFNQNFELCDGFDVSESINPGTTDRGYPGAFYQNVDYHNVFVGHYMAGDLQHRGHSSINNNNLIYWKETKNMADGCSSHFFESYYANGNLALPDQGTIIFSRTKFGQNVHLEANHHCDVGVTGILCMPQYIFDDTTWENDSPNKWVDLQAGYNNDGGIFSLAPGALSNGFFPNGFTSLAGSTYSYLLSSPGPRKCIDSTNLYGNRYDGGILCNAPLRSFKIYSRYMAEATAKTLKVEVWFNSLGMLGQNGPANAEQLVGFHIIGGPDSTNHKQGYSFPIISGLEQSYRISLYDESNGSTSDIPQDWVIEFSDPIIGNRFGIDDQVYVNIAGRVCGTNGNGLISSQHDRKLLWSGDHFIDEAAWGGNGACTASADMVPVDCAAIVGGNAANEGSIEASECPELCAASPCNSANSYCHCGMQSTCVCKPGFTGHDCSIDVCSSAGCGEHGSCTAHYLGGGGDVPVDTSVTCTCEEGWFGETCNFNPCESGAAALTCSDHGKCISSNGVDTECHCEPGYLGSNCEAHNIAHGKMVSASHQIQPSSRAFDGNMGSRWESNHGVDDVWLQVDLGTAHEINSVKIHWEASSAKRYDIEVSDDGVSFTSVWSKTDGYPNMGLVESVLGGATGRFIRMHAFERAINYGYSIFEMQVFGSLGPTSAPTPWPTYKVITLSPTVSHAPTMSPVASPTPPPSLPLIELAQSKPSLASSVNGGGTADKAFDGNMGSRWESVHGMEDEWLQADLGSVYQLEKVIIHWEFACAKVYDIQVSNDGVSFTTIWSKNNGSGGMGTIESDLGGVAGRFVRMQGHQRATGWGYSIFEMSVYGYENNNPTTTTTSTTSSFTSTTSSTTTTAAPTPMPTVQAFISQAPTMTHYYTACGASGSYRCAGTAILAAVNELREVRCCADTDPGGWPQNSNCVAAGFNVWGRSQINGVCHSKKSFDQANDICKSVVGARLCTKEELFADCTQGTGCGFDHEMIWSSTSVSTPISGPSVSPTKVSATTSNPTTAPTLEPTPFPTSQPSTKPTSASPTLTPTLKPTPVNAPPVPSINLARGKVSSASHNAQPSSRAFDGNMGSRWESNQGVDDVWLQVDLGTAYAIDLVKVAWEFACAKVYDIQVSNDGVSFTTVWSKNNGSGGMGTIESDLRGVAGRFVRMQGHQRATGYGYSIWELEVYGVMLPTATPVVLPTGEVSTSSVNGLGTPDKAFDGNMESRWESVHGVEDVWLQADLGVVYQLDKVVIHWEYSAAKVYDIQVSNDGVSFNTIWSKNDGSGGMGTIESALGGVAGRFVRMQGHQRATGWGYSIFEMSVYGQPI